MQPCVTFHSVLRSRELFFPFNSCSVLDRYYCVCILFRGGGGGMCSIKESGDGRDTSFYYGNGVGNLGSSIVRGIKDLAIYAL